VNRRNLARLGLIAGAGASGALFFRPGAEAKGKRVSAERVLNRIQRFAQPLAIPKPLTPVRRTENTDYYQITMQRALKEFVPGVSTEVWGYNGQVPGPTLEVQRGRRVVVRHINALPRRHPTRGYVPATSVHLHGAPNRPQYDGYANDLTRPGQYKDYVYDNEESARTLWYHDHAVMHTAENVYMGLAAFYLVRDAAEDRLQLPTGRYDIPLVLRDVILGADGALVYDDDGHKSLQGDIILVNGVPWPVMRVERRKYRFRILNGSLSRGYRLALSTRDPFTFIGTDSGLMPRPQQAQSFRIVSAERYEVVIDFSQYRVGQRVILNNLGVKNSEDFDWTGQVMAFDVTAEPTSLENNTVPPVLSTSEPLMGISPAQAKRTRHLRFERQHGHWVINGQTWADVQASGFRDVLANPALGDVEIWEVVNKSGGWFHPVHLHLVDFRILSRNGAPPRPHELGVKDTADLGENETLRLLVRFGPHQGKYMLHCHNSVHEDHDMMHQFRVGTGGTDPLSVPARPLPAPPL
jgi:FtsP/CotA-like multicopper oxidase with cupredoxin domain